MTVDQKKKALFKKLVWDFYADNQRNALPWRKKITPYKVWVSEIMLQQTQVDRVVNFFNAWMKWFPTIGDLAKAPQTDVLRLWKGLGYNSRALRMKKAAEVVVKEYGGKFPKKFDDILSLPGIGPYTAGAITAFAYNEPVSFIETNIRRVYLHHFFQHPQPPLKEGTFGTPSFREGQGGVLIHDKEIMSIIEETLDHEHPREWYWALMDYGSHLGKTIPNPNRKSRHYTKQSTFKGSDRQMRGRILAVLLENKKISLETLREKLADLTIDVDRIEQIVSAMETEGFLEIKKGMVRLKK